jgi:hypothetical protein
MKKGQNEKKTAAEFAVAVVAAIRLVWRQNRQRSLPQEGSGYVPADFQAEKTKSLPQGRFLWKDEETDSAGTSIGGF